jgi:hypothetical protein
MDLSQTIFPSHRITEIANKLSQADHEQFMQDLEDAVKPFRDGQLKAERAIFEKYERIVRPPAGSRPEDFPEGSQMRSQMGAPKPKPTPSIETKS